MLNRNSCSDFRSEIGESLDADHELRLRHTEHAGARAIVLDAEIDESGRCSRRRRATASFSMPSTSARVAIIDSAIMSERNDHRGGSAGAGR